MSLCPAAPLCRRTGLPRHRRHSQYYRRQPGILHEQFISICQLLFFQGPGTLMKKIGVFISPDEYCRSALESFSCAMDLFIRRATGSRKTRQNEGKAGKR